MEYCIVHRLNNEILGPLLKYVCIQVSNEHYLKPSIRIFCYTAMGTLFLLGVWWPHKYILTYVVYLLQKKVVLQLSVKEYTLKSSKFQLAIYLHANCNGQHIKDNCVRIFQWLTKLKELWQCVTRSMYQCTLQRVKGLFPSLGEKSGIINVTETKKQWKCIVIKVAIHQLTFPPMGEDIKQIIV